MTLLGLNSVPAIGWFVGGWSAGTTLGLCWVENVVATLFVAARIQIHSRVNPRRGHFKYNAREGTKGGGGSFMGSFLPVSLVFSTAHGFFLAVLVFVLTQNGKGAEIALNWDELLRGSLIMIGFLVADFLIDLPGLKKRPFIWVEKMGDRLLARVILVHMTIILGLAAVAFTGATRAFFAVFVILKTMGDLSTIFPQWNPKEPPAWFCRIMDKVPNAHPGESFAEFWKKDDENERARREANERPWKAA